MTGSLNFILSPKGGRHLTGPVNDNRHEIHPCYSDFIIAELAKVEYLARSNVSEQRRLRDWKAEYPYRCRTSCPGADLQLTDFDRDVSITPPSSPALGPGPSQVLRNHTLVPHLAIVADLPTPVPSLVIEDTIMHRLPSIEPTNPTTNLLPFIMPGRPTALVRSYRPDTQPEFMNFEEFEGNLQRDPLLIDDYFRVSGSSVDGAARALISSIKSSNQNHQTLLHSSPQVRGSDGQCLSLSNILLYRTWLFDA